MEELLTPQKRMEMRAYEAFLRRAAQLDLPFMLKGSYVTRQYFDDPMDRIPGDLDWVYMERLDSVDTAKERFDEWAIKVTETWENDGVAFRSFKENAFWRMIDYAMADDFPTVNTDLLCWVDFEQFEWFALDVSFNLDLPEAPVTLLYRPLQGEPFIIPRTAPLSLQVAWKLHQTAVRARFKDIFDLVHLLQHASFNEEVKTKAWQALMKECATDKTSMLRIKWVLNGHISNLMEDADAQWAYWRHGTTDTRYHKRFYFSVAKESINTTLLPDELKEFANQFATALKQAGFHEGMIAEIKHDPVAIQPPSQGKTVPPIVSEKQKPANSSDVSKKGFFTRLFGKK